VFEKNLAGYVRLYEGSIRKYFKASTTIIVYCRLMEEVLLVFLMLHSISISKQDLEIEIE
jgi:hypothetical protein